MTTYLGKVRVSFLIRHGVRYLLVSRRFYIVEAVIVLTILSFMLTGSRIAAIDHYGNRADIVATIVVTIAVTALLTLLNRRVKTAIDRHFFGEEYNAKQILTELGEAIPTLLETRQVLEFIADKIDAGLRPQNVTIFLDDEDRGAYVAAYSSDASNAGTRVLFPPHNLLLHYEGRLVSRLRESKQLISVDLTEAELSDHEGLTLQVVRSSVLIPIVSHHHFHGLISLGQRLSGLPYVKEDKLLLLIVANQIAAFLSSANPHSWPLPMMRAMMKQHLALTTKEAVARLQGKWAADVAAYDQVHAEILHMSTMVSDGIIRQFAARF